MQNLISQLQYELELLKTAVSNMIRPATVTYVYRKKGEEGIKTDRDDGAWIGFVDVRSGDIELQRIPVYQIHNEEDTTLWLPTVGEDGNIFSPSGDLAQAFFISSIPTKMQNIPTPDGPATQTIKTEMRQGNKEELLLKNNSNEEVNQYTHEIGLRDDSFTKFIHGDNTIVMEEGRVFITNGTSEVELEGSVVEVNNGSFKILIDDTKIRQEISTTAYKDLLSFLANIIGAHFYTTGVTTVISPVGPCFFTPAISPASLPSPPAGSSPDANGQVTKIPPQQIDNITIRSDSDLNFGTIYLIITTPIPVVTPVGPGSIVAGRYPVSLEGTLAGSNVPITGELDLTFPAKDL